MPCKSCCVFGCLNTTTIQSDASYFSLPTDLKRRQTWLKLILREDLQDRIPRHYLVCEHHFAPQCILISPTRKILKKDSIPSLNLPRQEAIVNKLEKQEVFIKTEFVDPLADTNDTLDTDDTLQMIPSSSSTSLLIPTSKCRKRKSTPPLPSTSKSRQRKSPSPIPPTSKSRKKILKKNPSNVNKKQQTNHKNNMVTFYKLCDKYLTTELTQLVKAFTQFKLTNTIKNTMDYKLFCLKLYFTSPQSYAWLQQSLYLPNKRTLRIRMTTLPVTTDANGRLMMALKAKVDNMTNLDKVCSIVIGVMDLKANLFYDITKDKIIGFHEVDGAQIPIAANNALVVIIQGISGKWKQVIGFALLAESKRYSYLSVTIWLDDLIKKLFHIGLNIKSFITDLDTDFNIVKERSVTVETPYFYIDNHKIYYIFDPPHLMKLFRDNFMLQNFKFHDSVAKYDHILQFYESDKKKTYRLAPKLTESHLNPQDFEKGEIRFITQLISASVATGILAYVEFEAMDESAKETAILIKKMNDLYDTLNSSSVNSTYEYKKAFRGNEFQIAFLNSMLVFLKSIKLVDPNGGDVTSNAKFIEGFQITIKSILLLFVDLKHLGCNTLLTKRLNKNTLNTVLRKIQSRNNLVSKPTSRQFTIAYRKIQLSDIMKPPKNDTSSNDIAKMLAQIKNLETILAKSTSSDKNQSESTIELNPSLPPITCSDYNQLNMPVKKSLMFVCGFLLQKCLDVDKNCNLLKSYLHTNEPNHDYSSDDFYTRYNNYNKEKNTLHNILIVPPDDFVNFVEKMDEKFRDLFKNSHINFKICQHIYGNMKDIKYIPPCTCFPVEYIKNIFIRMRIYFTIKFNNRAYNETRANKTDC